MPLGQLRRYGIREAFSGICRWKMVSKVATIGTAGPRASRVAPIAARAGPLCSGASSPSSSIAATTSSSTSVGAAKRLPPSTTRCPTASVVPASPCSPSHPSTRSTAAPWSATSAARRVDPSAVARSTVARRPIPSTEPQARRSSASGDATGVSESRNFSDDEPQLIASTLKGGPPAPERRRAVFLC